MIHHEDSLYIIRKALKKSGQHGLRIHCNRIHDLTEELGRKVLRVETFLSLVAQERHRWVSADIGLARSFGGFQTMFEFPAPMLEKLSVEMQVSDPMSFNLDLSPQNLGRLRDIELRNLSIWEWNPDVFTGLRSLVLSKISSPPSLRQIRATLESSPLLETLELKSFYGDTKPTSETTSIQMSHLRNLTFHTLPFSYLHPLLTCIQAPTCRHINLSLTPRMRYVDLRCLDHFIPGVAQMLVAAGGLKLHLGPRFLILEGHPSSPSPGLQITLHDMIPLRPLQWVVSSFANVLASLRVEAIMMAGLALNFDGGELIEILGRLQNLRELKVEEGVSDVHLLYAQMSEPRQDGSWPFAGLHTLTVKTPTSLVSYITRMVQERYRHRDDIELPAPFQRLALVGIQGSEFGEIESIVGAENLENFDDMGDVLEVDWQQ